MNKHIVAAAVLAAGGLLGMGAAQAVPAVVAVGPGYVYAPSAPAYATGPSVIVQPAPPTPLREVVPGPRDGYVWSPGHYEYRDGQYTWVRGYWVAERPGHRWESAHWAQRPDGSWMLVEGRWLRDNYASDDWRERREEWRARRYGPNGDMARDGVANYDDRDRDGDGVPNRYDRFPNDPGRS